MDASVRGRPHRYSCESWSLELVGVEVMPTKHGRDDGIEGSGVKLPDVSIEQPTEARPNPGPIRAKDAIISYRARICVEVRISISQPRFEHAHIGTLKISSRRVYRPEVAASPSEGIVCSRGC